MTQEGTLPYLVARLEQSLKNNTDITSEHLWYAIRSALDLKLIISGLAEAMRVPIIKKILFILENK
jgi:hypothetical protein